MTIIEPLYHLGIPLYTFNTKSPITRSTSL
nr:MAG TPA: hypothetical protein [Caudoviricetes sp.]